MASISRAPARLMIPNPQAAKPAEVAANWLDAHWPATTRPQSSIALLQRDFASREIANGRLEGRYARELTQGHGLNTADEKSTLGRDSTCQQKARRNA